MIEHTQISVTDYVPSKSFYQKVLAPLGYKMNMDMPEYKAAGFMEGGHTSFWIVQKEKVQPTHVAFGAKGKKEIDEFYKIALENGAKDNGKPGPRPDYAPGTYAAFVHDPDGNNIEAVWFDPEAKS